jgi:thiosulfate/3-mercaptopyruvate sulfurtransferase
MAFTTLISTTEVAQHLGDPNWAIVDCRFSLADSIVGRRRYEEAHIPGAVYAHLDEDLSGKIVRSHTGRHPLPAPEDFAQVLSRWGIDNQVQVIAYDDAGGMMAGRLWWMLRWMGHNTVAVLDGDWRAWVRENQPTRSGIEQREARVFVARLRPEMTVDAEQVMAQLQDVRPDSAPVLFDARSAERYRGENETLDAKAGHIPGACSSPFSLNLTAAGYFKPQEELRARFETLLGELPPSKAIFYCGSGVTAAHNLLAMAHAGLDMPRLYAGSWSEWIVDPARPIATGEEQ